MLLQSHVPGPILPVLVFAKPSRIVPLVPADHTQTCQTDSLSQQHQFLKRRRSYTKKLTDGRASSVLDQRFAATVLLGDDLRLLWFIVDPKAMPVLPMRVRLPVPHITRSNVHHGLIPDSLAVWHSPAFFRSTLSLHVSSLLAPHITKLLLGYHYTLKLSITTYTSQQLCQKHSC